MERSIIAIIGQMLNKWDQKKKNSFAGAAVIDSLLEEVNAGLDIIKKKQHKSLPKENWNKIKTVPYEVMSIISKSSKVMDHCKNYFENITKNYKLAMEYQFLNGNPQNAYEKRKLTENSQKIREYREETENLIEKLEQTKLLLEKNYKK